MTRSRTLRASIALALVAVLALAFAAPAFASVSAPRGPVPSAARVGGTDLLGLSEPDARAAILAATTVPTLAPLDIVCDGTTRTVDPNGAVLVDVEAMLDESYATTSTTPFDLTVRFAVDTAKVASWLAPVSAAVDRAAVDARYVVSGRRLAVTASSDGRRADVTTAASAISAALLASVSAGGAAQPAIVVTVSTVAPRVTPATIGRALLVVLSQRRLYSYAGGRLERTYGVAVGMSRYPTPRGTFRIVAKRANPSWTNPGSSWARSMPRYIKPGPSNPLGTRAMYLNVPGIRIHGTSKASSIGRAASHGCVRMRRADIESLFPRIPVGTTVFIVR